MRIAHVSAQPTFGASPRRNNTSENTVHPFDVEAGNNVRSISGTSQRWSFGKIAAAGFIALLGIGAALTGGIAAACNIKPSGTAATARKHVAFCPDAHLMENGDVRNPLFRYKAGHISPDGKARDITGLAKGEAREDGKLYNSFLNDNADFLTPFATVDKNGNVKDWPIPTPIGKIRTHKNNIPRKQRDALGLWM